MLVCLSAMCLNTPSPASSGMPPLAASSSATVRLTPSTSSKLCSYSTLLMRAASPTRPTTPGETGGPAIGGAPAAVPAVPVGRPPAAEGETPVVPPADCGEPPPGVAAGLAPLRVARLLVAAWRVHAPAGATRPGRPGVDTPPVPPQPSAEGRTAPAKPGGPRCTIVATPGTGGRRSNERPAQLREGARQRLGL